MIGSAVISVTVPSLTRKNHKTNPPQESETACENKGVHNPYPAGRCGNLLEGGSYILFDLRELFR